MKILRQIEPMTGFDRDEALARLSLLANYLQDKHGLDEDALQFYEGIKCVARDESLLCRDCPISESWCEDIMEYQYNGGTLEKRAHKPVPVEEAPGLYGMTGMGATSQKPKEWCTSCGGPMTSLGLCRDCFKPKGSVVKAAKARPWNDSSSGPTDLPPPSGGE